MEMSIVISEMLAALQMPGCALCRLHEDKQATYIRRLLTERLSDGFTLGQFAASYGWCSQHAWLLQASDVLDWGDSQKAAIMYEVGAQSLLREFHRYGHERAIEKAREEAQASRPQSIWRRLLGVKRRAQQDVHRDRDQGETAADRLVSRLHGTRCTLCEAMDGLDDLVVRIVSAEISSRRLREAWATADPVCLPHLRGVLAVVSNEDTRQWLVDDARAKFDLLASHLDGYMRGYGRTDRDRFTEAEWTALDRTVAFFAGEVRDGRATDAIRMMREEAREQHGQGLRDVDATDSRHR